MNIIGVYSFKDDEGNIIRTGKNIITTLGEAFFLNRWINEEFNTISHITLGISNKRPNKNDTSLGRETVRKSVQKTVNLSSKTVILNASFEASEIINTQEIGVLADGILISHDIYDKILDEFTSTVHLNYKFILNNSVVRGNWSNYIGTNVYYVSEPNTVIGVTENNNNSGYVRKNSIEEVSNNYASYYYDISNKIIYIKTTNGEDPNNNEIVLKYK